MRLARAVEKFVLRWLRLRENSISVNLNCFKVNFLYLLTLKISCVQLNRLKSLNLEGPDWGETPIFVRFSLFLISTYSENLIHLALMV